MPELVEVETTRRDLEKVILGKRIRKTEVYLDKIVYDKKYEFIKETEGQKIISVKRRGKWLLFELDNNYLIIHFRMEGRFYLKKKESQKDKHDYVIFTFDDFSLHYNDPRLFGKLEVIKKEDINKFFIDKKLGLEYTDSKLDMNYLKEKFKNKNIPIKTVLLDQSYITGIGNIYADEVLFLSGINPYAKASLLSKNKLQKIIDNTKVVFEEALKHKGTYPNIDGTRGTHENYLRVHMRKEMPCINCGTLILKEKIGGRGTYYCPKCQKR